MENINTRTTDTFITADGKTVRYQDVFDGIAANVRVYATKGGKDMSREDLEDTFQNAAFKAIRSHGSFNAALSSPRTYGSRIADNREKDAFRKTMTHACRFTSLEWENEDGDVFIPSEADGRIGEGFRADSELETSEAISYIEEKMAGLSENLRFVLGLHLQGLKPKKIAEQIGCTPGAASALLFRARKALARELGSEFLSEYGLCA